MIIKSRNRKIAGFSYNEDSGILMVFEESAHVTTYFEVFFESKESKVFPKDIKIQRTTFNESGNKIKIYTIWKNGETINKIFFIPNPR